MAGLPVSMPRVLTPGLDNAGLQWLAAPVCRHASLCSQRPSEGMLLDASMLVSSERQRRVAPWKLSMMLTCSRRTGTNCVPCSSAGAVRAGLHENGQAQEARPGARREHRSLRAVRLRTVSVTFDLYSSIDRVVRCTQILRAVLCRVDRPAPGKKHWPRKGTQLTCTRHRS